MSLVAFLTQYCGASLAERRDDDPEDLATLVACLIALSDGRRLILIERTYRDGVQFIADPSEAEIAVMRSGDLWDLWNSGRSTGLGGIL
jgi:hypothetical protein